MNAKKTHMAPLDHDPLWGVEERAYHPAREGLGGTQYCLGNGYMGLRGSYEELGTRGVQGLFVAGVFRKERTRQYCTADTFCRKKYIFNEELMPTEMDLCILQNLPDPLHVRIVLAGVPFRMWDGTLLEYARRLDLQTGELLRLVRWDNGAGQVTRLEFTRFCSMEDRRVIAQRVRVTPENWSGEVRVESGIDASLNTEYQESVVPGGGGDLLLKTIVAGTGVEVCQAVVQRLTLDGKDVQAAGAWNALSALRRYKKATALSVGEGQSLELEKFTALATSRDADPESEAWRRAKRAAESGYEALRDGHTQAWRGLWKRADIRITGDDEAQRGIRFALFHLMIAVPDEEGYSSVGAKGLSGSGYSGHVFWDTDIYLAPFYQWTFPEWGKGHARYRARLLEAARERARSEDRKGARYPWQSSVEGYEHAPESITCSRTQIHVVPDVAYMMLRYGDITGDIDWTASVGFEVVIECTRYMAERVQWNDAANRFEILGVGGPDEYHPVSDNNAYTNYLTAYVLDRCATSDLLARWRVSGAEREQWREIAAKMYLPGHPQTGLIPQCDAFHDLKDEWERAGSSWGGPGAEYHECKGLKQPDVLLLQTLLPDRFSNRQLLANWDYYERFVQHGSSLSPSTHALIAAKLGLVQRAKFYFDLSAMFDFVDYNKDSADGIHIGNFGGLWQAVVYGFAGLTLKDDELHFDARLPREWRELRFPIIFRGNRLTVRVTDSELELESDAENPSSILFRVRGNAYCLPPDSSQQVHLSESEQGARDLPAHKMTCDVRDRKPVHMQG